MRQEIREEIWGRSESSQLPAIDEPIAQVTAAGATTYFHTNKQGSVIAMSGAGAAKSEGPYTYDAYGNCFLGATANACTSAGEPYRFTGRRFDPETGLYYYRARYYSASLGRFLETDPVGYTADLNLYTYVGNDPTNATDPTGKDCVSSGGMTTCTTSNYTVTFPQQPGFHDFTTQSPNYHAYSTPAATPGSTLKQDQQFVTKNPTPGFPSPATPQGTLNDATPVIGGISPVNISPVKSFTLTNQKDNQPVVVNVTEPGHPLESGIVVREPTQTPNGTTIQNWGEGTSRLQAPGSPVANEINNVWKGQTPPSAPSPTGCFQGPGNVCNK